MTVRSLQDQVDSLLNKGVVQPKVGGVASPDIETASVIESLALAMSLQPRSAFYSHYLAKNGMVAAIHQEVLAIDTLRASVQDLSNTTFAIQDTRDLNRAQAAMLQLGSQGQLSSDSSAFNRYSVAVDDFLNNQLARNIKRPNSTEMVRPGEEAGLALPDDLTAVKNLHSDFLDRLYALAVGISNFANTPFSSLVGANAVYRAKKDLDSLVTEIEADESGAQSRDAAVRLIAGRATVKMLGKEMDLRAPVVDTALHLPPDKLLHGVSVPTPVSALTSAGPFVMALGGSLSMTIDGQTVTTSALSQAANAAAVLSDAVSYPVSAPANYHLFLRLEATAGLVWTPGTAGTTAQGTFSEGTLGAGWTLDGAGTYFKTFKVVLNSGSATTTPAGSASPLSLSLATVLSVINTALGALGSAVEFVGAGSNRILIIASEPKIQRIAIASSTFTMEPQSAGYSSSAGATVYVPRFYSNSFHVSLGFQVGAVGEKGSTPTSRIFDALQIVFPSLVTMALNADGTISLTSLVTTPGVSMVLVGTWVASLGLSANNIATSTTVELVDETGLVVSPIGVVDVGDLLTCSTGAGVIASIGASSLELDVAIQTFSSDITVTSALYLVWVAIDEQLQSFLATWVSGPFASSLASLDQVIAVLIGSPTSPRKSDALDLLDTLKTQLLALQAAVITVSTTLPVGSASKEKVAVNNIISLFTERKFDRALDLLLRCKLQEIFEVDWQSASYSGNLMKAVEGIAQADVKFPDMTQDEGFDVAGRRNVVR